MNRLAIGGLVLLLVVAGCGEQKQELNLFVWPDYITDEIAEGFEAETGVKVIVTTFDSNESLLARLQAGAKGYDLIMPSDYMASIMIQQELLEELNQQNIPNLSQITRFQRPYFDPDTRYAIPHNWGSAGIAYDSAAYPDLPQSWTVMWDEAYRGKVSMLDDMRETLGAALKLLGHSVNTGEQAKLDAAKRKLIEQKPLLKKYDSQSAEALLAKEVSIAHAWSGDAFRAATDMPSVRYFIPKEGSTVFIDTLCIPKGAPHKESAEKFIDYLLRPETSAKFTEYTKYATCVGASRDHVSAELQNDPTIYLPDDAIARLEWLKDLGEFLPNYDRAWTEVKASQ